MGLIQQAAISFCALKTIEYRFILSSGRNKPLEIIELNFLDNDLFHILGLQHLSDIELPGNKLLAVAKIFDGSISDEYISKSELYTTERLGYSIKERIEMVSKLEECLDAEKVTVSIYKLQHDNITRIKADYLITCVCKDSDVEYYIFTRKRKESSKYSIVSCFPKRDITYWGGKR